jgi:uncharacterized membrane protein YdjX (TVP38/TMEM64 family)
MKKILKFICISLFLVLIITLSVFFYIKFSSTDCLLTIKNWFDNGLKGAITYILLIIFQLIFVPISSIVLIVPALLIFGALKTFYLTLIALTLGSIITYFLGLKFSNFTQKVINKNKRFINWFNMLKENNKILLPYFCFIPIFPDEIICLMSGVLKINFFYFLLITILSKFIHLLFICFFTFLIPTNFFGYAFYFILFLFTLMPLIFAIKRKKVLPYKK